MVFTYYDAAALLFGEDDFTAADFARRTGNGRAAKVLSELKTRGLIARVARGRYRCLRPNERPDYRAAEWDRVRRVVLSASLPKAWTGPSAVEAWTGGRYKTASSVVSREFYIAVPEDAVGAWKEYLSARGVPTGARKSIGPRVILESGPNIRVVEFGGEPVIPRDETIRLIRSNPALYADAEDLLAD